MLNVCFGDSECGVLRFAFRREDVIYSQYSLEHGEIRPDRFEAGRQAWADVFFEGFPERIKRRSLREDARRFQQILRKVKRGKAVRIWYADNPSSMCGFYHLVYSLQQTDCRVFAVEMPEKLGYGGQDVDRAWGMASVDAVISCLPLERELTKEDRDGIAQKWRKLAEENAPLRLTVGGELISVPSDYLDEEILSRVSEGEEISIVGLVGRAAGYSDHFISTVFIESRIRSMIKDGVLVLMKEVKTPRGQHSNNIIKRVCER